MKKFSIPCMSAGNVHSLPVRKRGHCATAAGFTLVELILVVSLSVTIAFMSVLGFVQFNNVQQFNNAVSEVSSLLQKAKSNAISQVKPRSIAACSASPLGGFEVQLCGIPGSACAGAGKYNLYVLCGGSQLLESRSLPSDVSFESGSTATFTFQVLNGAATQGAITITGYGKTSTIQVSPIGNISVQ